MVEKKLIRELMLTRAYQMSASPGDALAEPGGGGAQRHRQDFHDLPRDLPAHKAGNAAMRPIQNTGDLVERKQLTPWETYTQALLLSNEASYVN